MLCSCTPLEKLTAVWVVDSRRRELTVAKDYTSSHYCAVKGAEATGQGRVSCRSKCVRDSRRPQLSNNSGKEM
jgi:hypothetical protein